MANGIILCGLNGCGKTTLGRLVAERLGWRALDVEPYWFPSAENYGESRAREEVQALLLADLERSEGFVFSSVNCSWGEVIERHFCLAVYLAAPKEVRLERIRQRERLRFGERVLEGGDLYASQQRFHVFAEGRSEEPILAALQTLSCPVLKLNATLPPEVLADEILRVFHNL